MNLVKTDTWYSRYPADYVKDTLLLTLEEDGFYSRALDQVYLCRGRIPADPIRLRLLLRVDQEQWSRCAWVLEKFFYLDGNTYGNRRADREIARAQENAKKAQENGKKGGRPPKGNPEITHPVSEEGGKNNPEETQGLTKEEPSGNPDRNPEKSSPPPPPPSSSSSTPPVWETRTRAAAPAVQADYTRAMEVLKLYPSQAKKDKRVIVKDLPAQNLLAARIAANPDYPWEEHARLMNLEETPKNAHAWAMGMPDTVALENLRSVNAPAPRKEYYR